MYATLCIALCDQRRRFLYFDISKAATTHDYIAFRSSSLGVRLERGELPSQFFIGGDSAFVPAQYMVVPTNGQDDNFDFYLPELQPNAHRVCFWHPGTAVGHILAPTLLQI